MDTFGALATSAIHSCTSLLSKVAGLPDETDIINLRGQLQAFHNVLAIVQDNMCNAFANLDEPVRGGLCICQDLDIEIKEAASTGLQDWTTLEWRGQDIAANTTELKMYTLTIAISLISVASRSSNVILLPSFVAEFRNASDEVELLIRGQIIMRGEALNKTKQMN